MQLIAAWVQSSVQVSRWRGSSGIDGSALTLPMLYTIPSLFPTSWKRTELLLLAQLPRFTSNRIFNLTSVARGRNNPMFATRKKLSMKVMTGL
jgi:hypothetical protein